MAKKKPKPRKTAPAKSKGIPTRRFECQLGTSKKFWNISQSGKSFTVQFGRIGTTGQEKCKSCSSPAAARVAAEKLIAEKSGKGYVEVATTKLDDKSAANELRQLDAYVQRNRNRKIISVSMSSGRITNADLTLLSGLQFLVDLQLSSCNNITDEGLKSLENLSHLEKLDLGWTNISDAGLKSVEKLSSLTELRLSGTRVTDAGMKCLSRLSSLRELDLGLTSVTKKGLAQLVNLLALEDFEIGGDCAADQMLSFEFLAKIRRRRFDRKTRGASKKQQRAAALEALNSIGGTGGGAGENRKTDEFWVNLFQSPVVDKDLGYLRWLPEVTNLDIGKTYVSDRGFACVSGLKRLKWLNIAESKVTSLKPLRALFQLEYLDAGWYDGLTDSHAKYLKGLTNLRELRLPGTAIGDLTLRCLHSLSQLQYLKISSTCVSQDAVDELQRVLPTCKIEFP